MEGGSSECSDPIRSDGNLEEAGVTEMSIPDSSNAEMAAEQRSWKKLYLSAVCECMFFFQAEDGIRDVAVTGVQTCALPISCPISTSCMLSMLRARYIATCRGIVRVLVRALERNPSGVTPQRRATTSWTRSMRSEERRVGKECRSRWPPYR